jgi:AraC-like DNA-binding protein
MSKHEIAAFDVLGDVLSGLGLRTRLFCRMEVGAPWSLRFSRTDLAHFHAIEQGACWLERPQAPAVPLASGDVVVLTRGGPYQLADRPGRKGTPFEAVVPGTPDGRCAIVRQGGKRPASVVVCGTFGFEHPEGHPILSLLPDVVRVTRATASAWSKPLLDFLAAEAKSGRPGSATILSRLTDVLFVQVVRTWLATQPDQPSWLRALNDPRLARALAAVHEDPARDWTVGNLASQAGMSRSPFASRFTDVVGEPPHAYLARVRMQRAALLLREGVRTLEEIAAVVGYDSVSSFSRVFKQRFGTSPGAFRRAARAGRAMPP